MGLGAKVAEEQQCSLREHFSAGNPSCMQVAQLLPFTSAALRRCRECAQDLRGWMQPASLPATFFHLGAPVCCLIDLWHNVQQYPAQYLRAKNEQTGRDEQHSCFSCCTKGNYTGSKSPPEETRHEELSLSVKLKRMIKCQIVQAHQADTAQALFLLRK